MGHSHSVPPLPRRPEIHVIPANRIGFLKCCFHANNQGHVTKPIHLTCKREDIERRATGQITDFIIPFLLKTVHPPSLIVLHSHPITVPAQATVS
jgi:hypothetical protein